MARTARLPAPEVVRELFEQGMTYRQIGDRYGVTAEAVRISLKRSGAYLPAMRFSHGQYVPWKLRSDHTSDILAQRLRHYSTVQQGGTLKPEDQRKLDNWIEFMDGANPTEMPLSVHYDRHDPDGFWLEPRQPGDRDYISPPD